jgi:hypothetical protein
MKVLVVNQNVKNTDSLTFKKKHYTIQAKNIKESVVPLKVSEKIQFCQSCWFGLHPYNHKILDELPTVGLARFDQQLISDMKDYSKLNNIEIPFEIEQIDD